MRNSLEVNKKDRLKKKNIKISQIKKKFNKSIKQLRFKI